MIPFEIMLYICTQNKAVWLQKRPLSLLSVLSHKADTNIAANKNLLSQNLPFAVIRGGVYILFLRSALDVRKQIRGEKIVVRYLHASPSKLAHKFSK